MLEYYAIAFLWFLSSKILSLENPGELSKTRQTLLKWKILYKTKNKLYDRKSIVLYRCKFSLFYIMLNKIENKHFEKQSSPITCASTCEHSIFTFSVLLFFAPKKTCGTLMRRSAMIMTLGTMRTD